MGYLLCYISTAVPAESDLSVSFFFFSQCLHTDLDVACGDLDRLCLCQIVMHIRHCEYKWRTQHFLEGKKQPCIFFLKVAMSKG